MPDDTSAWKPVQEDTSAWKPVPGGGTPSLVPGTPNSGAAGRFAGGLATSLNPVPMLTHPIDTAKAAAKAQVGEFSKAKDAATGKGEFSSMTPLERASSTFGHGLAGVIPLAGPAAANAGERIGSGDVAGGLGQATGLLATAATPALARAGGRGLSRTAEPLAEQALGIRAVDRKFGRAPGRAALDETTGVRPETVAGQAQTRMNDLTAQRNNVLATSKNTVDLGPSRNSVSSDIGKAGAGNSLTGSLEKVQEHLNEPHPGFAGQTEYPPGSATPVSFNQKPSAILGPGGQPLGSTVTATPGAAPPLKISQLQDPMNALALRQRLGNDFTKFDMARPVSREQMAVGNKAYGALTNAIHSAAPESAPLDRRISNLVPIKESADVRKLQPDTMGRVLTRIARPTGALIGAGEGYRAGGIPGALAGLVIPEMLTDPTAQMIGARVLDSAGKVARSPITGRTLQTAQVGSNAQR